MERYGFDEGRFTFQLRCKKMFTNIKTRDVEKELKRLIGEEIIRGRRKEKILETLRYI
jgi:hypothetical protein